MSSSNIRHNAPGNLQNRQKIAREMLHRNRSESGTQDLEPLVQDLAVFPDAWLEKLHRQENLDVAVVKGSETLADTTIIKHYGHEELLSQAQKVDEIANKHQQQLLQSVAPNQGELTPTEKNDLIRYYGRETEQEILSEVASKGIGFSTLKVSKETPLSEIHGQFRISPDNQELFNESLMKANKNLAQIQAGSLIPGALGFVLIPFEEHLGARVSPVTKESYNTITANSVFQNKGQHYYKDHLIVMHQDYVENNPYSEDHRILIHEVGHAIDHLARANKEWGKEHLQTITEYYQEDLKDLKEGDKSAFLTSRATDSVEEYFAEAVEAYFTHKDPNKEVGYKKDNHREALAERNPKMFGYLQELFQKAP